jgi:hypothetical protein
MPDLNLPNFVDTYVIQSGSGSSNTYDTSTQLKVGATSNNVQALSLLRIPLNSLPQPTNARVTGAELNLYSEFSSAVGEPIAIRPVLQAWNTSANGLMFDGVNNWSQAGGRGLGTDLGAYVDLQDSVASGWMNWDVSEAVQAALAAGSSTLSLAIYASNDITSYSNGPNVVTFTSTDGTSAQHPWLNLTWSNGTGTVPATSGINAGPANDSVSWHCLQMKCLFSHGIILHRLLLTHGEYTFLLTLRMIWQVATLSILVMILTCSICQTRHSNRLPQLTTLRRFGGPYNQSSSV